MFPTIKWKIRFACLRVGIETRFHTRSYTAYWQQMTELKKKSIKKHLFISGTNIKKQKALLTKLNDS